MDKPSRWEFSIRELRANDTVAGHHQLPDPRSSDNFATRTTPTRRIALSSKQRNVYFGLLLTETGQHLEKCSWRC